MLKFSKGTIFKEQNHVKEKWEYFWNIPFWTWDIQFFNYVFDKHVLKWHV